ncbi:MAG: glycosyltransferase family 2 protein [Candidatus Aenigmatarchaeota archaeon]
MRYVALVPAFNEEENIEKVIKLLKNLFYMDVVVVDDGSKDRTAEIARKSGAIVLKHKINKGKGEALRTGLNYILKKHNANYVVLIDADMQYHPKESVKLLKLLEKNDADIVMGYRNWKSIPYFRHRLGNFFWRSLFNLLFGTKFKDTNCGFMAMNRIAIKKIKNNIHGGYIIENSILASALKNKLKVMQVPVSVKYKKKSGIRRGIRIFLGVSTFILWEGLKYRLGIN